MPAQPGAVIKLPEQAVLRNHWIMVSVTHAIAPGSLRRNMPDPVPVIILAVLLSIQVITARDWVLTYCMMPCYVAVGWLRTLVCGPLWFMLSLTEPDSSTFITDLSLHKRRKEPFFCRCRSGIEVYETLHLLEIRRQTARLDFIKRALENKDYSCKGMSGADRSRNNRCCSFVY